MGVRLHRDTLRHGRPGELANEPTGPRDGVTLREATGGRGTAVDVAERVAPVRHVDPASVLVEAPVVASSAFPDIRLTPVVEPQRAPVEPRQLVDMQRRLLGMARAMGGDFSVAIAPGATWAYDPSRKTLSYPPADLLAQSEAHNLGAVAREVGRQLYACVDLAPAGPQGELWRVVDTLRTNKLMAARFSGAAAMLQAFHAARPAPATPAEAFEQALTTEWLTGKPDPTVTDPTVRTILDAARPLMERATALPSGVDLRFDDLSGKDATAVAAQALSIIQHELWPLYQRIAPEAEEPPPRPPQQQNENPSTTPPEGEPRPGGSQDGPAEQRDVETQRGPSARQPAEQSGGDLEQADKIDIEKLWRPEDQQEWQAMAEASRFETDAMTTELERFFLKVNKGGKTGWFKDGDLDMQKNMESLIRKRVTGKRDPFVYTRRDRTIRNADVVLTIDTSGSMEGERLTQTKCLVVMLEEAMESLKGVRRGYVAYNERPSILKDLDEVHGQKAKEAMLRMMKAGGQTNQLAALTVSGGMLQESNARQRIIVFLSDGEGGSTAAQKEKIAQLEAEGVKVLAVAFDLNRTEKKTFFDTYKYSLAIDDPAGLPQAIGEKLTEMLTE